MVKIALLHATLPKYLETAGMEDDAGRLEITVATTDRKELIDAGKTIKPHALVLDLDLLGENALEQVEDLEAKINPELTLIVYSFAKWKLLEDLRTPKRQLMRAPVSVRALRTSMVSLIVRQMTSKPGNATAASAAGGETISVKAAPPERKLDNMKLTALQEIRSSVDCECPNQLADLVLSLNAFEDYSKQCQNRNEEDAKVHAMNARLTGHARAIMEQALEKLCEFEGIDMDNPTAPTRQSSAA
ncbi:MAG: hypothetical protein R3200_01530 [Xanthomonadales bacterium]|nr:hypothetical protein [Xanthomonadales bacterium]